MRHNRGHTVIISSGGTQPVLRFYIRTFWLKTAAACVCLALLALLFLISDYFQAVGNQMEWDRALQEKARLKKRLYAIQHQFDDLREEVLQLKSFNQKVRRMTSVAGQSPFQKRHGKVTFGPELTALAAPAATASASAESAPGAEALPLFRSSGDLLVSMERLQQETKLVRQDAWDIHSALLRKKEVLSGTPSILPVKGWISSPFGYRNEPFYSDHDPKFHQGLDIAADIGSPVLATAAGRVIFTGYDDTGYGKLIVIDHGWQVTTVYAHLSEIQAEDGQWVSKGDAIGLVGNTGKSTGPHVHYEIRWAGVPVDPVNFNLSEEADLKNLSTFKKTDSGSHLF